MFNLISFHIALLLGFTHTAPFCDYCGGLTPPIFTGNQFKIKISLPVLNKVKCNLFLRYQINCVFRNFQFNQFPYCPPLGLHHPYCPLLRLLRRPHAPFLHRKSIQDRYQPWNLRRFGRAYFFRQSQLKHSEKYEKQIKLVI